MSQVELTPSLWLYTIHSKNQQLERENEQLKKKSQEKIIQMEEENNQIKDQITRMKEENERLKKEQMKNKSENDNSESKVFRILGKDEIESMEKIEELCSGGGGKVFKVTKKEFYALKEMNIKNAKTSKFQQFIQEYEIMSML